MAHGPGVLLFASLGGYWVLERAQKHKGGLRVVGRLLGAAVILVSLLGVACQVWGAAGCKDKFCPLGTRKGGARCPLTPSDVSTLPVPGQ